MNKRSDPGCVIVNGKVMDISGYERYHRMRIEATVRKLREIGAHRIVELGSHPWAMTARMIDESGLEICATVSAEEVTNWPDDIGVTVLPVHLRTAIGNEARFPNYSANIERTLFPIEEQPDTIVACEIVEHLTRSPHIMFLNINQWLPVSGKLFVTTPNGAQFANPLRRKSPTPAYRCNVYERHSYLYTLDDLLELIVLCGFRVRESGYWNVHERSGPSVVYDLMARIPLGYFREKFMRTMYVVAEKERDVKGIERCPRVYDPRGDWEYIEVGVSK